MSSSSRFLRRLSPTQSHRHTEEEPSGCTDRCNCTVCHKSGFMHVRPASAIDDFFFLSPSDPFQHLGDYLCNDKCLHFFFCKTCTVQYFIFLGEGGAIDVDLAALSVPRGGSDPGKTTTKTWRPKGVEAEKSRDS